MQDFKVWFEEKKNKLLIKGHIKYKKQLLNLGRGQN